MTSTLLVLLLSQAEQPDSPPTGAMPPLLFLALDGTLRSGAFASLGLGVDHVR